MILAGLGVAELSMSIPSIAAIKAQLRDLSLAKVQAYAQESARLPFAGGSPRSVAPSLTTNETEPYEHKPRKIPGRHGHAQSRDRSHRHDFQLHRRRGQPGRERALESRRQRRQCRLRAGRLWAWRRPSTGFLGRDNAGAFEELFGQKKIADHFVRIAGQTRVGIKITDPVRGETTDINFPGPAPSAAEVAMLQAQIAALDAEWFVVAGSVPPGVDPAIYRDLVARLRQRGRKVMLDTSGAPFPLALEANPTRSSRTFTSSRTTSGARCLTKRTSSRPRAN